ncbi:hypothetical protein JYK14_24020 [Siccirubricoccus sp. KC 17139]|uniref:Uncharacterized protein n=1 Tax=Siccirubricoccus soli TaxID=2899147 RepID=A0ABT1DDE3_9PROT|nr:hypothetical protein [Siccirubricoccus soli]MCO6419204.1 hypothetical protein [Siccirubricoccus soli]MCP2685339.1 hypothetical protein [Siccirubricoccus soli]
MNGIGIAALLIGRLRPPALPGGPLTGPLLRLGVMCAAQLALFLTVSWMAR